MRIGQTEAGDLYTTAATAEQPALLLTQPRHGGVSLARTIPINSISKSLVLHLSYPPTEAGPGRKKVGAGRRTDEDAPSLLLCLSVTHTTVTLCYEYHIQTSVIYHRHGQELIRSGRK